MSVFLVILLAILVVFEIWCNGKAIQALRDAVKSLETSERLQRDAEDLHRELSKQLLEARKAPGRAAERN